MAEDRRPGELPPIGGDPDEVAQYCLQVRRDYYTLRRPWLRQVEENVRALAGHQYDAYIPSFGEFVDLSSFFVPTDERWRRYPVFNWLAQFWFKQSLAKLTENVPVLGAMPSSPDAKDAATAAIFQQVYRYEWSQMGMPEALFKAYGWLLTSGRFVLKLRWDPDRGDISDWQPPPAGLVGPDGRQLTQAEILQSVLPTAPGDLACDVISPTSLIMPYGAEPDWQKPWMQHDYLLPKDEAEDRFGCDLEVSTSESGVGSDDLLARMEYTSYYGNPFNPESNVDSFLGNAKPTATKDMVRVVERWHRRTRRDLLGRLIVVAGEQTVIDDINPYVTEQRPKVLLPFYVFDTPGLPFRQEGSTDLEGLVPVARAVNRVLGGALDVNDFNEQPTLMVNAAAVPEDQSDNFNLRGGQVRYDPVGTGDPAHYLQPPPLPTSLKETFGLLQGQLNLLGGTNTGAAGEAVTNDASGELQREVRFDADRPWGATLRLHSYMWERFGQGVLDQLAVCMTDQRLLTLAGDDQTVEFLTVRPGLFEGRVNIRAYPESSVLESRQDKQNRIVQMFAAAAKLPPEFVHPFLDSLNQPDLLRAMRPNAEAYAVAQQNVALMAQTGQVAPVLPEQDHATHITVVQKFQNTTAWVQLPDLGKQAIRVYRFLHEQMMAGVQIQQTQQAANTAGAQAAAVQQAMAQHSVTPPGAPEAVGPSAPGIPAAA